jgi:hypothetical protein
MNKKGERRKIYYSIRGRENSRDLMNYRRKGELYIETHDAPSNSSMKINDIQ